jgi:3-mercaptopyruvate sulfurtransferase SseA
VARRLEEVGFQDVTILLGGTDAWLDAGYPREPRGGTEEVQPSA